MLLLQRRSDTNNERLLEVTTTLSIRDEDKTQRWRKPKVEGKERHRGGNKIEQKHARTWGQRADSFQPQVLGVNFALVVRLGHHGRGEGHVTYVTHL